MPLFRRPDGTHVPDIHPIRQMMPLLMVGRNESAIYTKAEMDVRGARAWLRAYNRARRGQARATLFHLFMFACARMLHERPGVNRFLVSGRVYQRKGVFLSFATKKNLDDNAPLATVKLHCPANETFDEFVDRVSVAVRDSRTETETRIDREVNFLTKLPLWLLRLIVGAGRALDKINLLPASLIDPDPMFTSMFLANLGSINIDNAFHHLYEYGTCGIFGVVGTVKVQPDGRELLQAFWTFDERVNDGFYCMQCIAYIRNFIENVESFLGGASLLAVATPRRENAAAAQ